MQEARTSLPAVTRSQLLPHLLCQHASSHPERPYLSVIGGRNATYGDVVAEMNRYAKAFVAGGTEPGARVAIMAPNGIDAVTAWLGAAWIGALEVPVNPLFHGRMLRHVLAHSRASILLTTATLLARVGEIVDDLPDLRSIVVFDDVAPTAMCGRIPVTTRAAFIDHGGDAAAVGPGPEAWDICSVMYTSGTTGPSKGVLVPWAQYLASTRSQPVEAHLGAGDGWYSPLPLFHVSGKVALHMAALVGGRVVIRDTFSTSRFWDDIAEHDCTMTFLVSAMYQFLMGQPPTAHDADTPLRFVGMVPVPADIDDFRRRFGVEVCTAYNSTEISSPISSDGFDVDGTNARSAGIVRPGYECRLVDEHDIEVPDGELGELIVRADTPWVLMAGYLDDPAATAAAWRNGWFHTGDAFIRDGKGRFCFVDRRKDAIRRRGENISSLEVEAEVNAHPGVLESAAVPHPSPFGEDDVKVWVVAKPGVELQPAELHRHLLANLPAFMVPRFIELADELPKTDTMKVRKAELVRRGNGETTWDAETDAGGTARD